VRHLVGALFLCLVAILIILPALIVGSYRAVVPKGRGDIAAWPAEPTVRLYLTREGRVVELGLEEYVAGVVAAEMPASFHLEALKAQAVAARTYAIKRLRSLGGAGCDRAADADLCDDPTHHQAWLPRAELVRRWGFFGYYRNWIRVVKAVEETRGLILTYAGRPIDPVYHSTSGGLTEDARYVWGNEVPYLRSVPSPYEENSPYWKRRHVFSLSTLFRLLGIEAGDQQGPALTVLARSPSGRALEVRVAGRSFTGVELRRALGLPSTSIRVVEATGDRVVLETSGYGHGVGMSQYGADGLARMGWAFEDILLHYYRGVRIERLGGP